MDSAPPPHDRQHPSREPRFPIRVVAERTGLSPDVLRAWERRYGVVAPHRSDAGQRLYSEADILRLNLLVRAIEGGQQIGIAATRATEELRELLRDDRERGNANGMVAQEHLARAFAAVSAFSPELLHAELRSGLLSLGAPAFLDQLVAPLLRRIGDAWHAGDISIAQEHAASAVVRSTLGWIIDTLGVRPDAPRLVLACLAGEQHELGALLAAATAAQVGWRVTYLGADLPVDQLIAAARHHDADVVAVSIVRPAEPGIMTSDLAMLRGAVPPDVEVFAGGAGIGSLPGLPEGITTVRDLPHLRALLHAHAFRS